MLVIDFGTSVITITSTKLGWVTEWLIVHAWRACVPKGTGGSNPPPSAICVKRLDPRYLTANWRFGIKCFQNHSRNKYLITPAPAVLRIFFSPANPSRGGVTSGRSHSV